MTIRSTVLCIAALTVAAASSQVRVGADVLLEQRLDLLRGKRIGLICNHTSLLANGHHLADTLAAMASLKLVALFGPEHGIRGDASDGRAVQNGMDAKTGLPVYSLYGAIRKPTPEMLKDIDVLVFDIQDIGARFYTYESTMSLGMEAAAEKGIPYIVLDRPNPIGGMHVDGFVSDDSVRSFVGLHRIPIQHGMTMGELATTINEEGWLKGGVKAKLTVVRCEGWDRNQWYDGTKLAWVNPSPNMQSLNTATVYPGTCLFEGTNIAEGRGSEHPFELIGAPFVDGTRWADALNALSLPGVRFEGIEFTPREIPNVASNPKYKGERCKGVSIRVLDRTSFQPVPTAVAMLVAAKKLFPQFQFRSYIDLLAGTPRLRTMVDAGIPADSIASGWRDEVEKFSEKRKKYLLY